MTTHVATFPEPSAHGDLRAAFPVGRLWNFCCQRFLAGWRGAPSFMLSAFGCEHFWSTSTSCFFKHVRSSTLVEEYILKIPQSGSSTSPLWVDMLFSKLSTRSLWRNTWRVKTLVGWRLVEGAHFVPARRHFWLLTIQGLDTTKALDEQDKLSLKDKFDLSFVCKDFCGWVHILWGLSRGTAVKLCIYN